MVFETGSSFETEPIIPLGPAMFSGTAHQGMTEGKSTFIVFWFELDLDMVFDTTRNGHL